MQIISYQKHITTEITRELRLPDGENHQRIGTELATVDGITYVSLPEGAVLPAEQPAEIAASIAVVSLDAATLESIKAASPHYKLINARVQERIRAKYSADEEYKLLRLAVIAATPSADFTAYNDHVESCRAWGAAAKAEIGL